MVEEWVPGWDGASFTLIAVSALISLRMPALMERWMGRKRHRERLQMLTEDILNEGWRIAHDKGLINRKDVRILCKQYAVEYKLDGLVKRKNHAKEVWNRLKIKWHEHLEGKPKIQATDVQALLQKYRKPRSA